MRQSFWFGARFSFAALIPADFVEQLENKLIGLGVDRKKIYSFV